MSFTEYKEFVSEGDTVIVYLNVNNIYAITISAGSVFQTKYGALKHDEVIGKKYGKKVHCSRGWVHILQPTPELWTLTLPHRTQILYSPDISIITLQLELKPGSIVCEAGTGSGSLSHAILRTISPNGHLFTFDFHQQRVEKAQQEFVEHGLEKLVTTHVRDVVADGFGLEGEADAVFLDLPLPWEVVPSAVKAVKPRGGRICSFSPCIEQVQRTCSALEVNGFTEILTIECVQRPYEVRTISMPVVQVKSQEKTTTNAAKKNETEDAEEIPQPPRKGGGGKRQRPMSTGPQNIFQTTLAPPRMTGHTGYLTFATLNSKQLSS